MTGVQALRVGGPFLSLALLGTPASLGVICSIPLEVVLLGVSTKLKQLSNIELQGWRDSTVVVVIAWHLANWIQFPAPHIVSSEISREHHRYTQNQIIIIKIIIHEKR